MTDDLRPHTSIVIPVFNEVFLTRVCLVSLDIADLGGAQIVVVDNGSSDDTPTLLSEWEKRSDRHLVVRSPENLGFARGCNRGADSGTGDLVVFLNNDTFVLREWLTALLRPFADPTVAITGSRLLYPSGRIQHAGVTFIPEGPGTIFDGLAADFGPALVEQEYQAVTGASMAVRRSAFEEVGGFDTAFHNSYEDVDLCLKVGERGGRIFYVPDSVAYHWESMTQGRLSENDLRNKELFTRRWQGKYEPDFERRMQAAEQAGYDLSGRLPSRREQHDRQVGLEDAAGERDILAKELAGVRSELDATRSERDYLRLLTRLRSVRAALWVSDRANGLRHRA